MEELWKPIPDYGNYEVSNLGRVRNVITGKILKPIEDAYGYLTVGLYNEACSFSYYKGKKSKKPSKKKIHNLVATAFCECPDDGINRVPDHIDRDKHNNRWDNLRWATRQENALNADYWGKRMRRHLDPIVLVKDGEIVGRYASCADASEKLGLAINSIACNVLGRRKGFKIGNFFLEKNLTMKKNYDIICV